MKLYFKQKNQRKEMNIMFVRIDKDLSVNINNIFSYKLSEDIDSYKLQVQSNQGNLIHNIIYLKERPDQVQILIDFNNTMRDLTVNPEVIREQAFTEPTTEELVEENEEKDRRIEEQLSLDVD